MSFELVTKGADDYKGPVNGGLAEVQLVVGDDRLRLGGSDFIGSAKSVVETLNSGVIPEEAKRRLRGIDGINTRAALDLYSRTGDTLEQIERLSATNDGKQDTAPSKRGVFSRMLAIGSGVLDAVRLAAETSTANRAARAIGSVAVRSS